MPATMGHGHARNTLGKLPSTQTRVLDVR